MRRSDIERKERSFIMKGIYNFHLGLIKVSALSLSVAAGSAMGWPLLTSLCVHYLQHVFLLPLLFFYGPYFSPRIMIMITKFCMGSKVTNKIRFH